MKILQIRCLGLLILLNGVTAQAQLNPSIEVIVAKAGNGHVVLDLDETIIDTTPRKYAAYLDTVRNGLMSGLSLMEFYSLANRYRLDELLTLQAKRSPEDECSTQDCADLAKLPATLKSIYRRYLEANYERDSLIPGARHLVRRLRANGATVWFVSGRSEATRSVTNSSLLTLGLWPDENFSQTEQHLLRLQPSETKESTAEFKRRTVTTVEATARSEGKSVALIVENEPENLSAMLEVAPNAAAIFVEGAAVKSEVPVAAHILRVRDFWAH